MGEDDWLEAAYEELTDLGDYPTDQEEDEDDDDDDEDDDDDD